MSENQNIEYKRSWRDEYIQWICGFANAQGGTIYIGKNDDGEVVGVNVNDAKKLLENIPNKVKATLGIIVDVNLEETPKGNVITIKVEAYPYPVNLNGQYHYRTGSTKQVLTGADLTTFLLRKTGKRWDGVPVPNVQITDLKQETLLNFRRNAFTSQRLSEEMLTDTDENLIENLNLKENEFLKRAAILLFHPNPEKFVTGAYVKIGYFESEEDLMFQDEVHGNLFEQIENTMDILFSKYLKNDISYAGTLQRIEKPMYPKKAIREALLNAIAHKNYNEGVPIQIRVYNDKIIIFNVGQLPENWVVENLFEEHPSKPFNPDIANALQRGGYIESWGRGTLNIVNEFKRSQLPKPLFYSGTSGFSVKLQANIYSTENLKTLNLSERQLLAIVHFKKDKKITTSEYAKKFKISEKTARRDIIELTNKELLIQIGKNKLAHYIYL